MTDAQFQKLLNRTVIAASKHSDLVNKCSEEIKRRYGIDYGEYDCDPIIDALDTGTASPITVADVEAAVEIAKIQHKEYL